jgi:hypothetical protein
MARLVSRVRKRDGSEESFDGPRLADSLRAAAAGVQNLGDAWADELVEAIRLEFGHTSSTIATLEIARLAAHLMREMGLHRVARSYSDFRKLLEDAMGRLRVHTRNGKRAHSRPWDRHQLALSLVRDRYLDLTTARRVSSLVERRLVMADLGHITGRVITAMADNECRSLGLHSDPLATEYVGVDRSELRAWLGGDCLPSVMGAPHLGPEGGDLRPALGEELLARFAIEEVLTPAQAEAISQGRFHLPHLGDWMRASRILLRWQSDENEAEFWQRVRDCRGQSHELQVFIPRNAAWTELSQDAPTWFSGGADKMRWLCDNHELARRWAQNGHWVSMSAASFAAADDSMQRMLAHSERVTLSWQPPKRLPPAAEHREDRLAAAAVINLARCAQEAGPWQTSEFMEDVAESLELACTSLEALLLRGRGTEHARVCLLPAGLDQALAQLLPDEALSGDRARRTILSLRAMFERHIRAAQLRPEHGAPPHPGPAGTRLAQRDGLNPDAGYAMGWALQLDSGVPASTSFQTAPWLQFPAAAAVQDTSWMQRIPKPLDIGLDIDSDFGSDIGTDFNDS